MVHQMLSSIILVLLEKNDEQFALQRDLNSSEN